ncbi:hypothetical protein SAMN05444481_103295 [Flavobacterium frigidimaris]|nr:hypothetical protein SAMN05444481_103295 [Flavobacterium frigidimaris]
MFVCGLAKMSFEIKMFWFSPDGNDILFPASLAGKRYSGQRD